VGFECRSLPLTLAYWGWLLLLMQWVHRTLRVYDGRLLDRHTWRPSPLAASPVRTSMAAKAVVAPAGSGRSCCLLRWRPATVVSTGPTPARVEHWQPEPMSLIPRWRYMSDPGGFAGSAGFSGTGAVGAGGSGCLVDLESGAEVVQSAIRSFSPRSSQVTCGTVPRSRVVPGLAF